MFKTILFQILFLFLIICIVFFCDSIRNSIQDHFLFAGAWVGPRSVPIEQKAPFEMMFPVPNGELHIVATHKPAHRQNPHLIFYLHGNGGSIYHCWMHALENLDVALGQPNDLVIATFDYRRFGHSISTTFPTPDDTIADANAVLSLLTKLYEPKQIYLYGRSLGAAVAIHLHTNQPLFLETPFLGEHTVNFPLIEYLPERFPCFSKIQDVNAKKHIVYVTLASDDNLICNDKIVRLLPFAKVIENTNYNTVCYTREWQTWVQKWYYSYI